METSSLFLKQHYVCTAETVYLVLYYTWQKLYVHLIDFNQMLLNNLLHAYHTMLRTIIFKSSQITFAFKHLADEINILEEIGEKVIQEN